MTGRVTSEVVPVPVEVVFFNVGQGDCTLLWFYNRGAAPGSEKGTHAVLIDCGTAGAVRPLRPPAGAPKGDARKQVVAHLRAKLDRYLGRMQNPNTLDCLIVTHPDQDHFNLLKDVLVDGKDISKLKYTVRQVLYSLSPLDYKEGSESDFVARLFTQWNAFSGPSGRKIETMPQPVTMPSAPTPLLDRTGANLYLLGGVVGPMSKRDVAKYQSGPKERIANLSSLVTVVVGDKDASNRHQRVVLMADAEKLNELFLTGYAGALCTRENHLWLKLGHHGSRTSNCKEWIEHTKPDGLFLSTGTKSFGGAAATCDAENVAGRLLTQWEAVRRANNIPTPRVGVSTWGFGFQDNSVEPPWAFVYSKLDVGLFSTLAMPPTPTGIWNGVDWHLRLDHAEPGSYEIWCE